MPIKPMEPVVETEIFLALTSPFPLSPVVATQVIKAISSQAAAGVFPGTPPIPIIPAGFPAALATYIAVLELNPPDTSIAALGFAQSVALVAPQVPPSGFATLRQQLQLSLDKNSDERETASDWAKAVTNYFTAGGVQ